MTNCTRLSNSSVSHSDTNCTAIAVGPQEFDKSEFDYTTLGTSGITRADQTTLLKKGRMILGWQVLVTVLMGLFFVADLAIVILLYRRRKTPSVKAAGLKILYLLIFGTLLLDINVLIQMWLHLPLVQCILSTWLMSLGNGLVIAGLSFQAWRIGIVLDFSKLRSVRVSNSEVGKRVALLIAFLLIYLIVCTFAFPLHERVTHGRVESCASVQWDYLIYAGFEILSMWGLIQCYKGRSAPKTFNVSVFNGIILYSSGIFLPIYCVSIFLLQEMENYWKTVIFLQAFIITSSVQVSFYMHKIYEISPTHRYLQVTVATVDEITGKHKVSLKINRAGHLEQVTCVPCGVLLLAGEESDGPIYERGPEIGAMNNEGDVQKTLAPLTQNNGNIKLLEMCRHLQRENKIASKQIEILRLRLETRAPYGLPSDFISRLDCQEASGLTSSSLWGYSQETIATQASNIGDTFALDEEEEARRRLEKINSFEASQSSSTSNSIGRNKHRLFLSNSGSVDLPSSSSTCAVSTCPNEGVPLHHIPKSYTFDSSQMHVHTLIEEPEENEV